MIVRDVIVNSIFFHFLSKFFYSNWIMIKMQVLRWRFYVAMYVWDLLISFILCRLGKRIIPYRIHLQPRKRITNADKMIESAPFSLKRYFIFLREFISEMFLLFHHHTYIPSTIRSRFLWIVDSWTHGWLHKMLREKRQKWELLF